MSASSMQAASGTGGDPSDPTSGAGGDDSQEQGYQIVITVAADNTMTVAVTPGTGDDDSDADDESEEGGSGGAQPVKTLNDLVDIVKQVVRSGGHLEDDGQADFAAGAGEGGGQ